MTLAECPTRAAPHQGGGPHRVRLWVARPHQDAPATSPIRVTPSGPDLDGPASFVVLLYEGARTAWALCKRNLGASFREKDDEASNG